MKSPLPISWVQFHVVIIIYQISAMFLLKELSRTVFSVHKDTPGGVLQSVEKFAGRNTCDGVLL